MQQHSDQRPEGVRTHPRRSRAWAFVRDATALLALWAVALYVVSRTGGDVMGLALGLTIAAFVGLAGGAGIEGIVVRKSWTFVVGCLVLAGWGASLPFAPMGAWLALPGLLGLGIVAITSGPQRDRDVERQRSFLLKRPKWGVWRTRLRRTLVIGMILGVAITLLTGLWYSIASA